LMLIIYSVFGRQSPGKVGGLFRHLQLVSSAAMAFTHGQNDAQKSMGIITLALIAGGFQHEPHVPLWVILSCATAMALGTSAGGYRIITVEEPVEYLFPRAANSVVSSPRPASRWSDTCLRRRIKLVSTISWLVAPKWT